MNVVHCGPVEFIADLHIHSCFSRATAKNLNLEDLHAWAQLKGITVVGTGDFTHPQWFAQIGEKLEPAEEGLFRLRSGFREKTASLVPSSCRGKVRFILSVEISSIYKKDGKTRKIHNVVLLPTLEDARTLAERLARIGNIGSDGRPILGLDAKVLLEMALEVSPDAIFIPAHIWTPWFSVLGSKSGFDSVEACFEDLTEEIFAVETGLSSDPAMNWRVSSLDRFTLVSNSDAHSPSNLGREANLFATDLTYEAMRDALSTGDPHRFLGTVEYFAEEGKYHFDGHRKCAVRLTPRETLQHGGLCPVCEKPVTVGVMHRVEALADRAEGVRPERAHPYTSLLPLTDLLSQALQVGPKSKKVAQAYRRLLENVGPEFEILRRAPLDRVDRYGPHLLAEGLRRMREGRVQIAPGFDGEFGTISLFTRQERSELAGQAKLFAVPEGGGAKKGEKGGRALKEDALGSLFDGRDDGFRPGPATTRLPSRAADSPSAQDAPGFFLEGLNRAQQQAVRHVGGPLVIVAGPGTGKTRTLTYRIAFLVQSGIARPERILAVTFTNKAAEEMAHRLVGLLKDSGGLEGITIRTFHALCLDILSSESVLSGIARPIRVLGETDRIALVRQAMEQVSVPRRGAERVLNELSLAKQRLLTPQDDWTCVVPEGSRDAFGKVYRAYEEALRRNGLLDFDDLILKVVRSLEKDKALRERYRERFPFISVDEYQDINFAQYRLIRLLAPPGHDICVIGDPHQAIYGFRGADVRYFKAFREDFPGARSIQLVDHYRSTETILKASCQIVARVLSGGQTDPVPCGRSGEVGARTVTVAELPTEAAEAEFIARTIESEVGGLDHFAFDSGRVSEPGSGPDRGFSDFAVLCRTKDQAAYLEEAFGRLGIPCQGRGRVALEDRRGVRELLSYLKVLWSLAWDLDVERVLELPGVGVGEKTLQRLKETARGMGISMVPLLERAGPAGLPDPLGNDLAAFQDRLGRARAVIRGKDLCSQIETALAQLRCQDAAFCDEACHKDVEALLKRARPFGRDAEQFVARFAMEQEQDRFEEAAEKVALLTMHGAKGLEFPVVFVVGCEDGLLPLKRGDGPVDLLEEGRLFFVALTRARQRVILTHVRRRRRFGKTSVQGLSPFVEAISEALRDHVRPLDDHRERPKTPSQLSLF